MKLIKLNAITIAILTFTFYASSLSAQTKVDNHTSCYMDVSVEIGTGCTQTTWAYGTVPPGSSSIGPGGGIIIWVAANLTNPIGCGQTSTAAEDCVYGSTAGAATSCCTSWNVTGVGTKTVVIY